MKEVIKILMDRDGCTYDEAIEAINECREYIEFCVENGDYEEAYYATESMLGLEPDYLDMILYLPV